MNRSLRSKDGLYATRLGYYLLWFEFLGMSPSYQLAHKFNSGDWSEADEAMRPADFDAVLEVYADLGDVQHQPFRTWWLARAFDAFGTLGERPTVKQLAYLTPTATRGPDLRGAADSFVNVTWPKSGQQDTLIVAIPVGLTRRQISKSINALLDRQPSGQPALRSAPPKYPFLATNFHRHTYYRYLYALWVRCAFPKEPLWKIGARAKISETYGRGRLDPDTDSDRHAKAEEKYRLKILAHRAIERGKMMAENAARGVFPSYRKCPHAMLFDLEELNIMRVARTRRRRASNAKSKTT